MPNVKQQEHVTKDGQPDHRYKENRDDRDDDYNPEQSGEQGQEHLTRDGQPDHRYKENRDSQDGQQNKSGSNDNGDDEDESAKLAHIPTKKDGRPDMRYNESREAVHAGLVSQDDVVQEIMEEGGNHEQARSNQRDQ